MDVNGCRADDGMVFPPIFLYVFRMQPNLLE